MPLAVIYRVDWRRLVVRPTELLLRRREGCKFKYCDQQDWGCVDTKGLQRVSVVRAALA